MKKIITAVFFVLLSFATYHARAYTAPYLSLAYAEQNTVNGLTSEYRTLNDMMKPLTGKQSLLYKSLKKMTEDISVLIGNIDKGKGGLDRLTDEIKVMNDRTDSFPSDDESFRKEESFVVSTGEELIKKTAELEKRHNEDTVLFHYLKTGLIDRKLLDRNITEFNLLYNKYRQQSTLLSKQREMYGEVLEEFKNKIK